MVSTVVETEVLGKTTARPAPSYASSEHLVMVIAAAVVAVLFFLSVFAAAIVLVVSIVMKIREKSTTINSR